MAQLDGNTFIDKYPFSVQCGLCANLRYTGGKRGVICPIHGDFQDKKKAQDYWVKKVICPDFKPKG